MTSWNLLRFVLLLDKRIFEDDFAWLLHFFATFSTVLHFFATFCICCTFRNFLHSLHFPQLFAFVATCCSFCCLHLCLSSEIWAKNIQEFGPSFASNSLLHFTYFCYFPSPFYDKRLFHCCYHWPIISPLYGQRSASTFSSALRLHAAGAQRLCCVWLPAFGRFGGSITCATYWCIPISQYAGHLCRSKCGMELKRRLSRKRNASALSTERANSAQKGKKRDWPRKSGQHWRQWA